MLIDENFSIKLTEECHSSKYFMTNTASSNLEKKLNILHQDWSMVDHELIKIPIYTDGFIPCFQKVCYLSSQ
jgi:hypothetical protein